MQEFFSLYIILLFVFIILFFVVRRLSYYKSENKALQDMLISLLAKYSNRDNILSNYVYDIKLGVYKHKSNGLYYCHKCFIESTKESPLKPKKDGLHCPVCGSIYKNPENQFPA